MLWLRMAQVSPYSCPLLKFQASARTLFRVLEEICLGASPSWPLESCPSNRYASRDVRAPSPSKSPFSAFSMVSRAPVA